MQLRPAAAQMIWAATSLRAWRQFRAALRDPAGTQARLLQQYVEVNRDTAFGRAHGFARIRSVAEYQQRVPVTTADELDPFVQRVAAGEPGVLTQERPCRLTPSSGSTRAVKLIPCTRSLQRELARAVDPWIADLFLRHPRLLGGPAYWSITPASPPPDLPPGTIPIGFDDDSRYLGGARHWLARAALVLPPAPATGRVNMDRFRRDTLRALLLAPELRLISVWHPSFLTLLLEELARNWGDLLDDLAPSNRRRSAGLRRISPADLRGIWPHLQLVSCWADGPSAAHARALAERMPGIRVQPKGLIATEGVVSIPFGGQRPIAIRSHFFEFLDPDGRPRLAHELERGVDYGVVMTTGGGLYRYRLGDRVRVDGRVAATPSLTFVGRDDRVSDLRGEKLSDGFVATVIETVFGGGRRPTFAMLAPDPTPGGVSYTLFVDRATCLLPDPGAELERALRRNPHYANCVDLGQLAPASVAFVGPHADRAYVEACVSRGQRLGNVKPVSLHAGTGWREVLPC
jgi:hypothetical protein